MLDARVYPRRLQRTDEGKEKRVLAARPPLSAGAGKMRIYAGEPNAGVFRIEPNHPFRRVGAEAVPPEAAVRLDVGAGRGARAPAGLSQRQRVPLRPHGEGHGQSQEPFYLLPGGGAEKEYLSHRDPHGAQSRRVLRLRQRKAGHALIGQRPRHGRKAKPVARSLQNAVYRSPSRRGFHRADVAVDTVFLYDISSHAAGPSFLP